MRKIVTVRLIGGPVSGREVMLSPPANHTLDSMPPRLTVNVEHHRHEYKYKGRDERKQHTYEYSHST